MRTSANGLDAGTKRLKGRRMAPFKGLLCGAALLMPLMHGGTVIANTVGEARPVASEDNRDRAKRFLTSNKGAYVLNDHIVPNWVGSGETFWYRRATPGGGGEFLLVDTVDGSKSPAFDHHLVAAELTRLTGEEVAADQLPFATFKYGDGGSISFAAAKKHFKCAASCEEVETPVSPVKPGETISPNGKWALFFKGYDLWVRPLDGGEAFALATDGEANNAFGISTSEISSVTRKRFGMVDAPLAVFSPDGNKAIVQRIDQRLVENLHLIQHVPEDGTNRPKLYSYPYAFALDEHKPMAEFAVFDLEKGERIDVDYPPIVINFVPHTHPMGQEVKWQADSRAFFFIHRETLGGGFGIHRVDAATGATKNIVDSQGWRIVLPAISAAMAGIMQPVGDEGVVWWSDQTGWGHLYFTDVEGNTRQLTDGDWTVQQLVRLDEATNSVIYLRGTAEDDGNPYHTVLASVSLEDGSHRILANSEGVRNVGPQHFSPDGKVFVDNVSATSQPGTASLRGVGTDLDVELEQADISKLKAQGTILPEEFQAIAADGKTRLWGKLFKPTGFRPDEKYPIVNYIYPGPQSASIGFDFAGPRAGMFGEINGLQGLAERGFIVVTVNSRGTPGRSRTFNYDTEKSLLGEAGYLVDQIAAIRQLAENRPYMDLDRVGIFGHSGGGYASTRAMLAHPDFYKVAVSGAGNHDQRIYIPIWGETYLGAEEGDNYVLASNAELASRLQGKLMLIVPNMDDNVHPAHSYRVMDALIKADKDFDAIVLPNANHGLASLSNVEGQYVVRRIQDYFVEHLRGESSLQNNRKN